MTLQCSCGCGRSLSERDGRINEFGELETMKQDCIRIGRGEESPNELLSRVWDEWLGSLDDEELDKLREV